VFSQFVDVCILAGCDYCDGIKGIAATTAHKLVSKSGSLAAGVATLDKEKHPLPPGVDYDEVRALFTAPLVTDPEAVELKWSDPDEAGIIQFLVTEKGFKLERVSPGIAKLKKGRAGGQQLRMDSFFKKQDPPPGAAAAAAAAAAPAKGAKRKAADAPGKKGSAGKLEKKAKK
jgi:flap endonuclease-1